MHFEDPWLLLLLLPLVLFYRFWMKRANPACINYSLDIPVTLKKINPIRLEMLFILLAAALTIVALARPQNQYSEAKRVVSGVDIMLVMDVSFSMNAIDMNPSRFDVAKATISKFIQGRSNDRMGLIIFSGEPLTQAPLTLDHDLVLNSLQQAKSGVLKDGTAIGDGLALAINRIKDSKAKSRIVVLLTDGDNNVGQLHPSMAGELAAGYGIKVYAVLIGKEGRVRIPQVVTGLFGQKRTAYRVLENALNPVLLEGIASVTGGKFFRASDEDTLAKVFKEIDTLEKSKINSVEKIKYDEMYFYFLIPALGFLVLALLGSMSWWRTAT